MDNLEIFKDDIANAIQSERYTLAQVVDFRFQHLVTSRC